MPAARVFTVPAQQVEAPIEFTIDGVYPDDGLEDAGQPWSVTFKVPRHVPMGVMFDLSSLVAQEDGRLVYSMEAIRTFLDNVLATTADVSAWHGLLHDRRRLVPIETLGEIVQWLASELSGRPTGPSSISAS